MSTEEGNRVSRGNTQPVQNLIERVQNLIERCLQLHMSQKEAVDILSLDTKIEPGVIELVWQKLEEENQEFFKAYNLRLLVKDQIMQFNSLLGRQCELMCQMSPAQVASIPESNGSHLPPWHRDSGSYAPLHPGSFGSDIPNLFLSGGVLPNILVAQNSHVGMIQEMIGGAIKSDGYAGSLPIPDSMIGDASVSSFNGAKSDSVYLNERLLDANGFPQDLSAADFTYSSGFALFLPSVSCALSFLDPHGRGDQQGDCFSSEGFASD